LSKLEELLSALREEQAASGPISSISVLDSVDSYSRSSRFPTSRGTAGV
jgi:hypothetical protein